VPLPKGDVHKKKEVIQDVTLHDLDIANARPQVFTGFCSIYLCQEGNVFILLVCLTINKVTLNLLMNVRVVGGV